MNAHAKISNMSPQDQRQHLSEMVRVAECEWANCESRAAELEEGRSIVMAEMKLNLVKNGLAKSMSAAEDTARTSEQWKKYLRSMHDARHKANLARADWRALDRDYWNAVSGEASERAQMRMAGGGR